MQHTNAFRFFRSKTANVRNSRPNEISDTQNSTRSSTPNRGMESTLSSSINVHAPLAILSANIQGLIPSKGKYKLEMINEKAKEENVGLMFFTETHLGKDHKEAEVKMKGFEHHRSERSEYSRRGGVIFYIRNDLSSGSSILDSGSTGNIEYIVVDVPILEIIVVIIYRPPSSCANEFERVLIKINPQEVP